MTITLQAFFELLALGVKQRQEYATIAEHYEAVDWTQILQWAKEQSVIGLVVDGIDVLPPNLRPPEELYLQACAWATKIEQSNLKQNKQVAHLFDVFGEKNLAATLMKGQGGALNYPNPLRRQCGDIDLYVGHARYAKTNKLMESLGADEEGDEIIKHRSWFLDGIEIEVHKEMGVMAMPSHYRHFNRMLKQWYPSAIEHITIEQTTIGVAPIQFDAVFLLVHILEHLLREGISLRQPIDWLVFMNKHFEELDLGMMERDLRKTGLLRFASTLLTIGVRYMGFSDLDHCFPYMPTDKQVELLLNEFMASGNFGMLKKKPKKSDPITRGFVIRKATSLVNIIKRLFRLYSLARGEASWFLWYTLKNSIYTRYKLMTRKKK